MNALKEPMPILGAVFGVKEAKTNRIQRMGHWVPYKTQSPIWANRPEVFPDESVYTTDAWNGTALGQPVSLTLVSPRPCTVSTGEILAATASGQPAFVRRLEGQGRTYLLGFCLQDTYFHAWEQDNSAAREQLRGLLHAITRETGIRPHVECSNADIEAALRANAREAFLFVINHESIASEATLHLRDLEFDIGAIADLSSGQAIPFTQTADGAIKLDVSVSLGEILLLHLMPRQ
jgi:hypothetical protein